MSTAHKDPRWREAERFAQRHARLVLARLDARVAAAGEDGALDLVGDDLAAFVEHHRSPVGRETVQRLHAAAGGRTAVCYARAGYTKMAVLWADQHGVALFGYTDAGHAAPLNGAGHALQTRALEAAEQQVRTAAAALTRHVASLRAEQERLEREAHAAALRAQEQDREQERRRRRRRDQHEATLGRAVSLLLALQIDPMALHATIQRLTLSTVVPAVADSADRLSLAERPHAVGLVRAMFDEAAGALEVATPDAARESPQFRAARLAVDRAYDALDVAEGADVAGHATPDDVAAALRDAERCWRALVAELVRSDAVPLVTAPLTAPVPRVPQPRLREHG
ncbi:hypothetical protein [Cellulomonas gilvus]|uniref:Uncharacterized protein n=1 Tax=Cellulomonas gilvus (strain ATCC 13127 / NRRL B-14078) TaxID=593907 RepID=F8A0I9_CELGA|nr:hypothetical protein [Cellulomonas gilvus]AEI11533.1 hypothetical protein Celgi_1014 [Cellulomonas gilvus ATCC 13127]